MFFDIQQRSKEVGEVLGTEKVKRQSSSIGVEATFWKNYFHRAIFSW